AAGGNDLVRVWIVPAGSHGLLEAADPSWAQAVYRTFFQRWATDAERTLGGGTDAASGLGYSPFDDCPVRITGSEETDMDSDIVRRLIWAGLLSVTGALATVAAHRLSEVIWRRVFNEEPPE